MKSKTNFLSDFLCIVLCVLLVILTVYCSDYMSVGFIELSSHFMGIKTDVSDITVSEKTAPLESNASVFSPEGFGGGGYGISSFTDTPDDILELMKKAEEMYKGFKKSGKIQEQQFTKSSANTTFGVVAVNNRTEESISIKSLLNSSPKYGEIIKDKPYILIYHTHTTEGYELLDKGWYSNDYNSRTKDSAKNMVRVGEELVKELENAGYNVIHDKTVYDSSYDGAYSRSLVSVNQYLKEYPSIVLTLDVHRDAIHYESGVKCKPTAKINGKKAAQVMIISGCEGDGVENFPGWKQNLAFAVHLHNTVEEEFEGLMRPIFFCHRKYNMNVTPCSLLLEFGTDANTLEEAVYSASLIGKSIAKMLDKQIKEK